MELAAGGAGPRQRCCMSLHISSAWTIACCCGALMNPSADFAVHRCTSTPQYVAPPPHHGSARISTCPKLRSDFLAKFRACNTTTRNSVATGAKFAAAGLSSRKGPPIRWITTPFTRSNARSYRLVGDAQVLLRRAHGPAGAPAHRDGHVPEVLRRAGNLRALLHLFELRLHCRGCNATCCGPRRVHVANALFQPTNKV